jgi:hypothetical protein
MTVARKLPLLLAGAALLASGPARAQELEDLLVKKGRIRGDQYLAAGTVDVHGQVQGDLYMVGLQAGLDGTVSGDVAAAGGIVHVGGVVGDDVRVLGGQVTVQGTVNDGLLAAGGQIETTRHTRVGGTAILGGRQILARGDVDGDLEVAGLHVEVDGDVRGLTRIRSDDVVIGPRARLLGGLVVRGANPPRVAEGARIEGPIEIEAPALPGWRERLVGASRAALLQVGLLLVVLAWLVLAPTLARDAEVLEWRSLGLAHGIGVAAVVGLPFAAVLLALTVVGIPVAVAIASTWTLLVLAGWSSTALCLGDWLRGRARRGAARPLLGERLLWTYLALLVLRAGAAIPWAGWAVTLGALLAGAGAVARAAQLAHERRSLSRGPPGPAGA